MLRLRHSPTMEASGGDAPKIVGLVEADELVRAHEKHGVLSDWTVPVCDFAPTFKLKRSVAHATNAAAAVH